MGQLRSLTVHVGEWVYKCFRDFDSVLWNLVQVIGHNNKYNCHKFVPGQPRGLLLLPQRHCPTASMLENVMPCCSRHRAFSVLLFDHENRLLSMAWYSHSAAGEGGGDGSSGKAL